MRRIIATTAFISCFMATAVGGVASTASGGTITYQDMIGQHEGCYGNKSCAYNNISSATGRYQMIQKHFQTYGFIDKTSPTAQKGGGEWEGVTWTGKMGINSREDFLNSKEAQDALFNEFTRTQWNSIQGSVNIGTTVNGVQMTQAGALGAAHFLGDGGFRQWASCGFQASCLPADAIKNHGADAQKIAMARLKAGLNVDVASIGVGAGTGGVGGGEIGGGSTPNSKRIDVVLMPWA